jgi:hypothetical protein
MATILGCAIMQLSAHPIYPFAQTRTSTLSPSYLIRSEGPEPRATRCLGWTVPSEGCILLDHHLRCVFVCHGIGFAVVVNTSKGRPRLGIHTVSAIASGLSLPMRWGGCGQFVSEQVKALRQAGSATATSGLQHHFSLSICGWQCDLKVLIQSGN